MVETLKSKSFQGARKKKLTPKSCTIQGCIPNFFCLRRHFSFFALQKKGSLEARFLHRTQKILPAAPFILFFAPQKEKCKRLTIHRRKHWFHGSNPREHFIGMHTVTTRERMPVQNHCPIQIIFPTSLGIPLHFAAKMQLDQSCKKFRARVARPGLGPLLNFEGRLKWAQNHSSNTHLAL